MKDKKKKKTGKKKIKSEETLEMLKQVMGNNKKENSMEEIKEENEEKYEMNGTSLSFYVQAEKKAKKGLKKGGKKKKEAIDTSARFFNSHSENPKLQLIENSYLEFLEAQHAKESHLKAIKKFQIMYALKRI